MKRLTILILGLMVFNAVFACEGKLRGGKFNVTFKDYPCCFVGIELAGAIDFTDCGKYSPEVLEEAKDIVRRMGEVKSKKIKSSLNGDGDSSINLSREFRSLDKKLTELTGYSYNEMSDMHNKSIEESGIIEALAK